MDHCRASSVGVSAWGGRGRMAANLPLLPPWGRNRRRVPWSAAALRSRSTEKAAPTRAVR
eukprot:10339173-Lingulodinium_polyedra.AAC.1